MIPAVVMGLIFHDTIKSLFNPVNVMYAPDCRRRIADCSGSAEAETAARGRD